MDIPKSHPRYNSLMQREKILDAMRNGIVAEAGLIAHGRGEAFDYLLGEKTPESAKWAARAAMAMLLLAKRPILSINGNTAVLAGEEYVKLAKKLKTKVEVNLFYNREERTPKVMGLLNAPNVIGNSELVELQYVESSRRLVEKDGISQADVVLVPLEDGDRVDALKKSWKKVICIDLNPLSRSARAADITIVDNVTRAVPLLLQYFDEMKFMPIDELNGMVEKFDNEANLKRALRDMRS